MFKGNPVFFKYLQYLAAKTNLGIHHVFLNCDRGKALFAGNTGDDIVGLCAGITNDHRTLVFRCIGIADIERDSGSDVVDVFYSLDENENI